MSVVHVAVGVILQHDQVLLSKRLQHQHQGGLWEFPGGKLEEGESVAEALARELAEELSIQVGGCSHFMTVEHQYPDKCVRLDFNIIKEFTGEPRGLQGQEVRWCSVSKLVELEFPEANVPVINALLKALLV